MNVKMAGTYNSVSGVFLLTLFALFVDGILVNKNNKTLFECRD